MTHGSTGDSDLYQLSTKMRWLQLKEACSLQPAWESGINISGGLSSSTYQLGPLVNYFRTAG